MELSNSHQRYNGIFHPQPDHKFPLNIIFLITLSSASLNNPNTSSFSIRLVLILCDNPRLFGAEETDDLRLEE